MPSPTEKWVISPKTKKVIKVGGVAYEALTASQKASAKKTVKPGGKKVVKKKAAKTTPKEKMKSRTSTPKKVPMSSKKTKVFSIQEIVDARVQVKGKLYSNGDRNFLCTDIEKGRVPSMVDPIIFLEEIRHLKDIEGIESDMYDDVLAETPGGEDLRLTYNPSRPQRMISWTESFLVLEGVIDKDSDGDVTMSEIKLIKAPKRIVEHIPAKPKGSPKREPKPKPASYYILPLTGKPTMDQWTRYKEALEKEAKAKTKKSKAKAKK